jgi:hypothetical protein
MAQSVNFTWVDTVVLISALVYRHRAISGAKSSPGLANHEFQVANVEIRGRYQR